MNRQEFRETTAEMVWGLVSLGTILTIMFVLGAKATFAFALHMLVMSTLIYITWKMRKA